MYFAVDPMNPSEIADKLVEIISASTAPNWTAVIDGAFDHGRGQCNYPGSPEALYACDELDAMLEVSPLLVPLKLGTSAVLKEQLLGIAQHCAGRPMFSVVGAFGNASDLIPNWQKCARVLSDDGQKMLLRFADTRILQVLPDILRHESWVALTHELTHWWYVDRNGTLAQVPVVPVASSDPAPVFPLAIGTREINRLLECGEPDAVIDAMSVALPEALPVAGKGGFFERIRTVCEFARTREIEAFPDVVALAMFDLLTGHRGLANPKLSKVVAERDWQQGDLMSKLVEISE